jgi:hypothetical protein
MLTGRQLYLLRVRDKNLSDAQLSEMLEISVNDILMYEYGLKQIPKVIYDKWERIVR